jgi:hypothetical protein
MVGVFENKHALDAVVEQLQFNNITQLTTVEPAAAPNNADDDVALQQRMRGFGVPEEQMAEYQVRLAAQRWLLFIVASALEVPTVQRALRAGQALDIDLLPDTL